MNLPENKLLSFNAEVLLNKRELIESFDDFVAHHREKNNEEEYSEIKRKTLLSLCDQFRELLLEKDIPTLSKPWYFYEYYVTSDSIELTLNKCDEDIEFDEEGYITSMTSTMEGIIFDVKAEYLTVEQYAKLYEVTTTTVRQWIRRGKLRTAKKVGRNWIIPEIADRPERGFKSVIYSWGTLDNRIIELFPFLINKTRIYLYQDEDDKKLFYAVTGIPRQTNREKVQLTSQERERLELMLIGSEDVEVDDFQSGITFLPGKRNFQFPILCSQEQETSDNTFRFNDVIVQQHMSNEAIFSTNDKPGWLFDIDDTIYLIPISWTFWGVPPDVADDEVYDALEDKGFLQYEKIGDFSGYLVLCSQLISDGFDPLDVCDSGSADLEYMMSALVDEGGPLNEETGEPMLDVLYIHELSVSEKLRGEGWGSRLIQELPFLVRKFLHTVPDIITYYPAPIEQNWHQETERERALNHILSTRMANAVLPEDTVSDKGINIFSKKYHFNQDEINRYLGRRNSGSSYPENLKNERLYSFYEHNGFQELFNTRLLYAYTKK